MLEIQELESIWVKLDEYKSAWMNEPALNKVEEKKKELRNQVADVYPNNKSEALEYFDNQCLQIQERWGRPILGRAIH